MVLANQNNKKIKKTLFHQPLLVEFSDALRDILVVAIPAIIAALGSKLIVHSWQVEKEKFSLMKEKYALKKQIIDSYQKGYIKETGLLWSFYRTVRDRYTVPDKSDGSKDEIVFPADEKDRPLRVFQQGYEELKKEVASLGFDAWSFMAEVQIYYDYDLLMAKLRTLGDLQWNFQRQIRMQIHSKDVKEFANNTDKAENIHMEIKNTQKEIAQLLATTPLRREAMRPRDANNNSRE